MKKGKFKVGDKVKLLEYNYQSKHLAEYIIIEIYDKKLYNLYLCENTKTKCRSTFVDQDLLRGERCYNSFKKCVYRG